MPEAPRISLVIPAYNEDAYLPRLLDSVAVAKAVYRHGADAIEVIVADNGSTDATAEIARQHGCTVVPVEKRVIAASRNGGAAAARGELLAFVDADMQIHPQTFNAIDGEMLKGRAVAGATGVTVERWSPGIAASFLLFLPLLWLTSMDTGVVFCRREDFQRVGGYHEGLLYAEDVRFLWDLARLGKRRRPRQRLVRLRPRVKAVSSTRKFDTYGDWHYFRVFPGLLLRTLLGRGETAEFAREYWYRGR